MNAIALRQFLRILLKSLSADRPAAAPGGGEAIVPVSDAPLILPPFGGELGHEVRSFLGRVEPWLRSGWKILAKRPDLYPSGTAIVDSAYFAQESALLQKYGAVRLGLSYHIPAAGSAQPASIASLTIALSQLPQPIRLNVQNIRDLLQEAQFESELRSLFAPYLLRRDRPLTNWDTTLLSVTNFLSYEHLADFTNIVVPSYRPSAFEQPIATCDPHVGVQLRSRSEWSPDRNSNPQRVLTWAKQAAAHLQLPILIYGHPQGAYLPEGLIHTADRGVENLLRRELGFCGSVRLCLRPIAAGQI
ncbi:MAG: hypothetical protein HC895_17725 [Leptolyngbyaceae cyanobacterium SM1_3_5]|nr:hypothetical protein [Leptolyngbyaceae cyanobacterium SM1_3_5]